MSERTNSPIFKKNKDFLIILIVMALYYLQHLISFRLGMNFEESRDANAYLLAIKGFLPYRDFEWLYGPFAFFIYPFIMKLFGVSLIVLRVSYIIFASLVIPVSYFLAKRIMPCFWAGIAAFLSIIFFDLPYYTFNHIFAVLGSLACLLLICRVTETGKRTFNLFWAGIFASIAVLTKPFLSGISLFIVVSMFLLLSGAGRPWLKMVRDYLLFVGSAAVLPLLYLGYFYSQTVLKDIPVAHSLFAPDSTLLSVQAPRMNLHIFSLCLRRLAGILPLQRMSNASSFAGLKNVFVVSFDNFIFCLPFIVPLVILLIYLFSKSSSEIKQKLYRKRKLLLLFSVFSVVISLESLGIAHRYGRAYTIQVPFILTAYILYLIKTACLRRPAMVRTLITLFILYISFLHFFRYPYSLRRKYTEPLRLERAGGILVTRNEQELYESLSSYLALNLGEGEKIAVMRYCPQIAFLSGQTNIFEDEEFIFPKLRALADEPVKTEGIKSLISLFEDRIISKMKRQRPKLVLLVSDDSWDDFKLTATVSDYVEKRYSLRKVFGPADVFGLGARPRWVKLYR